MVVCSMVPITLNPHITSFTMHNSPIQSLHEGIVYSKPGFIFQQMEFLNISYINDRVFFSMLFPIPSTGGFYKKPYSSLVFKIHTKNPRNKK
jgi:hypothetical protein